MFVRKSDTLTGRSGHYDALLTNMSQAVMQDRKSVARRVFPSVPVSERSNVYARYLREYFLRPGYKVRGPGSVAGDVNYGVVFDQRYFCDVYAERVPLDQQTKANVSRPINPEQDAVELLMRHADILLDLHWVDNYFKTGVWSKDWTGVASAENNTSTLRQFNDSSSDPIERVQQMHDEFVELNGIDFNKMVVGRKVNSALKNHPDIKERILYNFANSGANPAMADERTMAALFGVEEYIVADMIHDTNQEGTTVSPQFIFGKHMWMGYAPPRVSLKAPLSGITWSWTGYEPGTNDLGVSVRRYNDIPSKTEYAEAELAFDMTVSAASLGVFVDQAVA